MTWARSLRPPPSGWRGHPLNGRQCVRSAPQARSLCSQHAPAAFRTSAQLLTHRDKRPTSPGSTLLSRGGAIRCSHSVAVVGCVRLHPTFRGSTTCRSRPTVGAGMSTAYPSYTFHSPRWQAAQSAAPRGPQCWAPLAVAWESPPTCSDCRRARKSGRRRLLRVRFHRGLKLGAHSIQCTLALEV